MLSLGLLTVCFFLTSGLLTPMKNQNGDPNVGSIIHHVAALENTMLTFQSRFQSNTAELEMVKAKLRATEDKLQTTSDELIVMKTKLESQEKRSNISQIIDELLTDISFEVSLSAGRSGLGNFKFDTIMLNTGKGYNPKSGKFHTPVSGTYLFWANVIVVGSHHEHNHHLSLMADGHLLATGYGHTGDAIKQGSISMTQVVHLSKNARVHFEINSTSSNAYVMGQGVSSFGATLLRND